MNKKLMNMYCMHTTLALFRSKGTTRKPDLLVANPFTNDQIPKTYMIKTHTKCTPSRIPHNLSCFSTKTTIGKE